MRLDQYTSVDMKVGLLIFDFDGVIGDSEVIACGVAADYATELGYPVSLEDGLRLFVGKRSTEVRALVEQAVGRPLPDFEATLLQRTIDALANDLQPVRGVRQFVSSHLSTPRCIASSSSHARLNAALDKLGLADLFRETVFSADDVARGKPFPDLFLYAAERMGVTPAHALVIEDSPAGVTAGKAAQMTTIGMLAGSHVRAGLRERLEAAGADRVVNDFEELAELLI